MTTIQPTRLDRKRRITVYAVREHGTNLLFMLPAFLLFAFIVLIPFIQSVPISFTDKKAIFAKNWNFVGIDNYVKLLKNKAFLDTFVHTAHFTVIYILGANVLGLIFALMIWRSGRFNNIVRTLLFMPFTVSLVASTKVWSYVYTDIVSPLFNIPSPLGVSSQVILGLAIIAIWRDMGYCMLIYLAGMQSVPKELYEAATVDGAGERQKLIHVTLPMIRPVAFFVFITNMVEAFKTFDQVSIMTDGNPLTNRTTTIVHQIYLRAFVNDYRRIDEASAMAVVLLAAAFLLTMINFKWNRSIDDEGR